MWGLKKQKWWGLCLKYVKLQVMSKVSLFLFCCAFVSFLSLFAYKLLLFGVKVLLLVQLTLLNTDAEVSAMVSKRVQSRNRVRLCLDLVIMILLCREIFFTESKK